MGLVSTGVSIVYSICGGKLTKLEVGVLALFVAVVCILLFVGTKCVAAEACVYVCDSVRSGA